MPKATWKGAVLAESAHCEVVEGNQYFPPDSIRREYFRASETHTVCPWKGTASYYDVVVDGADEQGRRLVLPAAEGRGRTDQGPRRLLARRRDRNVAAEARRQ